MLLSLMEKIFFCKLPKMKRSKLHEYIFQAAVPVCWELSSFAVSIPPKCRVLTVSELADGVGRSHGAPVRGFFMM